MRLVYIGAGFVIAGAGLMFVSYHLGGPKGLTDSGKILALLGLAIYVVGRIQYRRTKNQEVDSDPPHREED